jgi:predicted metalloprotease
MTNRSIARRGRSALLTAMVGALAAIPFTTAVAAPQPAVRDATGIATAIEVTAQDVAASNKKVQEAFGALVAMWRDDFAQIGERFATPGLVRYRGSVRSGCGIMRPSNAGYCVRDNAIYYDDVFVAGLAKQAAQQLGTDGDMAAVGVIAHEMGHAVAMQLGHASPYTYQNEATADCLAGAFANRAEQDGSLEQGDREEAFYGMASAGDPIPELTGDRRTDRAMLIRAQLMGHGTQAQRTGNFDRGYRGGAGQCLQDFQGMR